MQYFKYILPFLLITDCMAIGPIQFGSGTYSAPSYSTPSFSSKYKSVCIEKVSKIIHNHSDKVTLSGKSIKNNQKEVEILLPISNDELTFFLVKNEILQFFDNTSYMTMSRTPEGIKVNMGLDSSLFGEQEYSAQTLALKFSINKRIKQILNSSLIKQVSEEFESLVISAVKLASEDTRISKNYDIDSIQKIETVYFRALEQSHQNGSSHIDSPKQRFNKERIKEVALKISEIIDHKTEEGIDQILSRLTVYGSK